MLNSIGSGNIEIFNEAYIENKYQKYMGADFIVSTYLNKLISEIINYDSVVIIAPGVSIKCYEFDSALIKNACTFSVILYTINLKQRIIFFKYEETRRCI